MSGRDYIDDDDVDDEIDNEGDGYADETYNDQGHDDMEYDENQQQYDEVDHPNEEDEGGEPKVNEEEEEIDSQEAVWEVISCYFKKKGLVSQTLDSFNQFIQTTMQELVDDSPAIEVKTMSQHTPGKDIDPDEEQTVYTFKFEQIYLSKPTTREGDGSIQEMFPNEARLRNLTYHAPLYIDVNKTVQEQGNVQQTTEDKVIIGRVPIMLRSIYCILSENDVGQLAQLGECEYDQGGYFIINGSEKVILAQEKMGTNHVYVFKKAQPHKYQYVAEIRSTLEIGNRPPSALYVNMQSRGSSKGGATGGLIYATIPYTKSDIPIVILFRALGFVADKDIIEHIIYDFDDLQLMEMLRPSM